MAHELRLFKPHYLSIRVLSEEGLVGCCHIHSAQDFTKFLAVSASPFNADVGLTPNQD